MNPIDRQSFQRIISAHGKPEGAAYFDVAEELAHEVFPERIVFQTNYLDYRSYEVDLAEGAIRVRKTRLDNYRRGDKAKVIGDAMDEEDWAELGGLWQRLSRDLDSQEPRPQLDMGDSLVELFYCLFDEPYAQELADSIPAPSAQWDWAWRQLEAALLGANQLAEFEWKEWTSDGVAAVNDLAPLRQSCIAIAPPDDTTIAAINRTADWQRALLQYFNGQLEAHDLKLLAIGTHFDERQSFACLPMNGLGLVNALEIMGRLGIIHRY
ncbi:MULTISPECIES: hypothetical protein [unclassified Pseudomonas]|uniref:hypothetical protein n=1 Tax=unclassified Pseudomonas TaxID=196821 RepID=UPI00244908D2|nr:MULTISPECIES: hypothetical protein [unclassified Pseudomonas]MDG9924444.1 hypothetical protein [Pseudomonas sp. GD04045]MDH0035216.1 hypothetical protein [Pseudomonas sp. GD04019]